MAMTSGPTDLRLGTPADALSIAALATQVFLDTYAPEGVRPDLAREAFEVCSPAAFSQRLVAAGRRFILAVRGEHLLAFAELSLQLAPPPGGAQAGAELVRLYVQPAAKRQGLGARLLRRCEAEAAAAGVGCLWLTAWAGNGRALDFYRAQGFADTGATEYRFEDRSYENRVFVKTLGSDAPIPAPAPRSLRRRTPRRGVPRG